MERSSSHNDLRLHLQQLREISLRRAAILNLSEDFVATKRCIEVILNFRSPLEGSRRQLVAWSRRETNFESIR
jgi:hypothetical protein